MDVKTFPPQFPPLTPLLWGQGHPAGAGHGRNRQVFSGSTPEIYDRLMVPLIFEPYARDLAGRSPRQIPSGCWRRPPVPVLTRALASHLPDRVRITATDLNEPMLAQAKTTLHDPRVAWQQADALALPFDGESFDAVASQFGAMFFPDRITGYAEARRVLRSGGRFFFNVWDRISENEFADVVTEALAEIFPQDPPRFLARTPHGYHDEYHIRGDLKAAGFTEIAIDAVEHRRRAPSPREPAIAYCQGTPLRHEIEPRGTQTGGRDCGCSGSPRPPLWQRRRWKNSRFGNFGGLSTLARDR